MKMKNNRQFAVFILSHGRADNVVTYKTLKRQGYTGKIYIIVDNEDSQIKLYQKNFGKDNVIIFNKNYAMSITDTADNFSDKRAVVYARNMCFEIAKNLELTHFLELDDDYTEFQYRYIGSNVLKHKKIKDLNGLFNCVLDFLDNSNLDCVALAQGGDYIGGVGGAINDGLKRKIMNTFFCRVDKPFKFLGKINEDVNCYVFEGSKGKKFLSVMDLAINQIQTQSNGGGLTDIYLNLGTYVKSFYSVIVMPSAVKISVMGNTFMRIHHKIKWNNCVPKIINQKYKRS